uniref:Uncharacterized protein n=2 Tax=Ursus TaxID=9639 RepID=A0A452UYS0_URSMA
MGKAGMEGLNLGDCRATPLVTSSGLFSDLRQNGNACALEISGEVAFRQGSKSPRQERCVRVS